MKRVVQLKVWLNMIKRKSLESAIDVFQIHVCIKGNTMVLLITRLPPQKNKGNAHGMTDTEYTGSTGLQTGVASVIIKLLTYHYSNSHI